MKIITLVLLALLTACGKDATGVNRQLAQAPLTGKQGSLTIPQPGVYGGAVTLIYGSTNYHIGNGTPSTNTYLNALYHSQIGVNPISTTSTYKKYRVVFEGSFGQGPCSTNPMATCPVVNLDWIQAY